MLTTPEVTPAPAAVATHVDTPSPEAEAAPVVEIATFSQTGSLPKPRLEPQVAPQAIPSLEPKAETAELPRSPIL